MQIFFTRFVETTETMEKQEIFEMKGARGETISLHPSGNELTIVIDGMSALLDPWDVDYLTDWLLEYRDDRRKKFENDPEE